jgi:hypothetical protein
MKMAMDSVISVTIVQRLRTKTKAIEILMDSETPVTACSVLQTVGLKCAMVSIMTVMVSSMSCLMDLRWSCLVIARPDSLVDVA